MRALWKGSVNFGLVNIPVKLYSATEQSTLNLDMVDVRDLGKIHFKRVNENTGKEVRWENIVKAYLYKDEYVVLDETDFAEAAPEKSKVIEVNHFVDETEIDTIYFENSYYIEPEKSGQRAYALLREALKKSGKVGAAQFVLRTAAALAVIKPMDEILVLNKIRFSEEIRSMKDFELPRASVIKPAELKMAISLIKQYTKPFDIRKYKDEYTASLMKIIKAKASGKRTKVRKLRVVRSRSQDLMEQLKASLSKNRA